MTGFISLLLGLSAKMGYWGVFLLMTIESSFIPLPSEIVIPPAAYLAQKGELDIILVVLFGVLGSVAGAFINYMLALTLGRRIIFYLASCRLANLMLINEKQIEKSEKYFLEHGNISTFIGRLVPAVRHLISIPAGFSKMNLVSFILFTTLGSSLWVIILAILGYCFGSNQDLLLQYYKEISYIFVAAGVVFAAWLFFQRNKKRRVQVEEKVD